MIDKHLWFKKGNSVIEKIYAVTFAHYGFVQVEAESELDAYRKVEGYGQEDISWSDDFEATDVQEEE